MNAICGRVRTACSVLVVGLVLSLSTAGFPSTAIAQPSESIEDQEGEPLVLTWPALGLGSEIVFDAADAEQAVQVPVPAGSAMLALTGQLRAPVELGRGYLEVTSADGRFLGSADIPDVESGQRVTPFSIDLAGAAVDAAAGMATLRMTVRPLDRSSAMCGAPQRLTAADLAVSFTAAEQVPETVDQFFPSVLDAVEVFVDPEPTTAEKESVLTLAAALVHRYGPIPVQISVRPLSRTAPVPAGGSGLTRSVVVREGAEAGASIGDADAGSVLVLSGTGHALADQVGVFTAGLDRLVQVRSATVTNLEADEILGTDTLTFEQLGAVASTSVLGSAQMFSGFDSSSFGLTQPGSMEVHLMADYTPVSDATATATISAGGQVMHAQELDSSGRVDTTFSVAGGAIARAVGLNVALTYSPTAGCTPFTAPIQFSIDPESTVTVSGSSGGTGGFKSLPTSLMPTFQVAFDEQDPEANGVLGLSYATRVVASMQTTANAVMRPMVAPMDEVVGSGMGALLVADADSLGAAGMAAPLAVSDGAVKISTDQGVTMDVDGGIGSLQVFAEGDRTVVAITTTGEWSLVGPVLDRATAGGSWADLSGDVVAAGLGGDAVPMTVVSDGPAGAVSGPERGWVTWLWIGASALVVAAAVMVAGLWMDRRRKRAASQ
ncbi:hypothetical protein BJD99_05760 [Rhodococcus sp. 1163]|uniref:hypothetical protein n=1 Tax=Rhodococcus sp. 1163 TaxID=1905289 RepID=UPI000A01AFCE|nr:hypothetical protein [Rhodococcus sp. 1163]ORI14624.1 hypothetical protein BJD99_05760 [Rhodococcus sp. 1163]